MAENTILKRAALFHAFRNWGGLWIVSVINTLYHHAILKLTDNFNVSFYKSSLLTLSKALVRSTKVTKRSLSRSRHFSWSWLAPNIMSHVPSEKHTGILVETCSKCWMRRLSRTRWLSLARLVVFATWQLFDGLSDLICRHHIKVLIWGRRAMALSLIWAGWLTAW